jgi:hypothetical protein
LFSTCWSFTCWPCCDGSSLCLSTAGNIPDVHLGLNDMRLLNPQSPIPEPQHAHCVLCHICSVCGSGGSGRIRGQTANCVSCALTSGCLRSHSSM